MNLEELHNCLIRLADRLSKDDQRLLSARIEGLASVYPFNEYEYMLTFLMHRKILSFEEYEALRSGYVSANQYLQLFTLAPRIFGQVWGEKHLMDLDSRFRKPDKALDADYDGQYDLWLEGNRVEVKASRAIHTHKRSDVVSKALHFESSDPFWMNFQQIKLDLCDVFVFIGVWVDRIFYWVLTNEEVRANPYLSSQHRGGMEYQIGIRNRNLHEFTAFRTTADRVAETIIAKGRFR